jgi:hypothetical protein
MKTHYKKLTDTNYFGSWDIEQTDLILKITKVEREEVTGGDGRSESCLVAHLDKNKPLILNSTNQKTIAKLFGPYVEDWQNKYFAAFKTKVNAFGETVDAVRIRSRVPMLDENHPAWPAVVKALTDKKTTLPKVKETFTIAPGALAKLEK